MEKVTNLLPESAEKLWKCILKEAKVISDREPYLNAFLTENILNHGSLVSSLGHIISVKLASKEVPANVLVELIAGGYSQKPQLCHAAFEDILATVERDPACGRFISPLLYFKGFQALQCHRIANFFFQGGSIDLAYYMQMMTSSTFSVDIHPAAEIGHGIFMDHAHGIVIGETAVVGNNVSLLHAVTLGGTGKEEGDRHPKIGDGVLIGAGAKVLGNVMIGESSKIASGSVVLNNVPKRKTVAGVPAKIVSTVPNETDPSRSMDHKFVSKK